VRTCSLRASGLSSRKGGAASQCRERSDVSSAKRCANPNVQQSRHRGPTNAEFVPLLRDRIRPFTCVRVWNDRPLGRFVPLRPNLANFRARPRGLANCYHNAALGPEAAFASLRSRSFGKGPAKERNSVCGSEGETGGSSKNAGREVICGGHFKIFPPGRVAPLSMFYSHAGYSVKIANSSLEEGPSRFWHARYAHEH